MGSGQNPPPPQCSPKFFWPMWNRVKLNRGENQALAGATQFCGENPGPQFEDKFRSANQMDEISKAGGDKMTAS